MPVAQLKRTVLSINGNDTNSFLGGLITNSVKSELTFAALLSPQGKIIADFFIHKNSDTIFLETADKFGQILKTRLGMYKLRSDVIITDVSEQYNIYVFWGQKSNNRQNPGEDDPRLKALGQRLLSEENIKTSHEMEDYDLHRMALGVPDSSHDFETGEIFPHNANMDLLSGIDFQKGCFIGQEVVSRMHRKTVIRKRMRAVKLTAKLTAKLSGPARPGDEIMQGGRVVGVLKHVSRDYGMALLRIDRLEKNADVLLNDNIVKILESEYV